MTADTIEKPVVAEPATLADLESGARALLGQAKTIDLRKIKDAETKTLLTSARADLDRIAKGLRQARTGK